MSPVDLVDHETGEVTTLSDAEAQSRADSIARELLEIAPTLAEAIADAEALDRRRLHLERELARLGIAPWSLHKVLVRMCAAGQLRVTAHGCYALGARSEVAA